MSLIGRRILLDTNLWSYLGDDGGGSDLYKAVHDRGCQIVLAPSVLLEVLRSPHEASRQRIVEAMMDSNGNRLASEAELCAGEFVRVVKRSRPEWIRPMADTARVATYHLFWTKKVWRAARERPGDLHSWLTLNDTPAVHMLSSQRENRGSILKDRFSFEVDDLWASPPSDAPEHYMGGWDGSRVHAWRVELRDYYWTFMTLHYSYSLGGHFGQTERDWVGSYVDISRATSDRADFTKLWIEEIASFDVKRDWLRWAVRWVQSTMKVTDGNPRDEQHSAYLVDADLFLSADKRFVAILQEIRSRASFSFADVKLVKADHSASIVDSIIDAIDV
ncbi:hypothetical protein [Rhodococcus erythropolis]|uniref:hypothetical protein n=1 Tax=Rhodococcus erythropolis TaxID=1833 RepID=UPI001F28BFCE|nr:hypothetical protein [Rhodococcus erythropolis]